MFFRSLFISIAIIFFIFLVRGVRKEFVHSHQVSVILVTVESLRYDMVSAENCPNLLTAAEKGYKFTNYRANSGWTGTNIVSLLSGLTPSQSGVHTRGQSVAEDQILPLEQLTQSGYTVKGLQPFMAMDIYKNLGFSIDSSTSDPLVWLARQKLGEAPFFLWYHYVHTHLPYTGDGEIFKENLPPRFAKITKSTAIHAGEESYTKEDIERIHKLQQHNIRDFDTWFKELFQLYISGGLKRDTILIVTSDHGDEHGERTMVGHASTTLEGHLHEEIVHVPFFVWLPDRLGVKGLDLDLAASHIDVMPSLMRLLNIESVGSFAGKHFLDDQAEDRIWSAMTSSGGFAEPIPTAIRYYEYSLLDGNWKMRLRRYLETGREELFLYDLSSDPGERDNLIEEQARRAKAMREKLSPLISIQISRPIRLVEDSDSSDTIVPKWIYPLASKEVSYDSLDGKFFLEWSGTATRPYLLEYVAGHGAKPIKGTLEVEGNRKDFGKISRKYWNTWIVPNSPIKIRVKEVGGSFSPWLQLEALP